MSNPNTDRQETPAGTPAGRDGNGGDGTGQASVGHECAGCESTMHASTGHECTASEITAPDGTGHESIRHECGGPDNTGHDSTGHDSPGHDSTGHDSARSRPGDLPEIEAPGLSAFGAQADPPTAVNPAAVDDSPPMDAVCEPDHLRTPFRPTGPARRNSAEPIAGGAGAAVVRALVPQEQEAQSPPPPEAAASPAAPSFGLRRLFAMTAAAAVIGGLAGSLTTAGFIYMMGSMIGPLSAGPSYDQVFADGLARIDHEVAVLKGAIDTSTRTQTQQVAKIAERIDRAEKAQNDAGTRLSKAGDVLDRVEHRLAASGEVTGGLGDAHRAPASASASAAAAAPEAKRPVVEGWVLRDIYRGAAMIQGHGGVIAVLPGDNVPGLGRIEEVKRQDGRWVVVTARGLILPR